MTTQPRVGRGIPTGGQFAAAERTEAPVALAPRRPALSPVQESVRAIDAQIRHLRSELDGANIQAAVECVRRDFPTAIELRVKSNVAPDGRHLAGILGSSLRDADGHNPAEGDDLWAYHGSETGMCLSTHLLSYEGNHRPSSEAFAWDQDTEEWVLPIRDYWEEDQP